MKSNIPILASSLATVHANEWFECYEKSAEVVNAVAFFCSADNITIPSNYAHTGYTSVGGAFVNVDGHCDPPDQVDENTCIDRFDSVCTSGDVNGTGKGIFGTNNCTLWSISNHIGPNATTFPSVSKKAASAAAAATRSLKSAASGVKARAKEMLGEVEDADELHSSLRERVAAERARGTRDPQLAQHTKGSKMARGEKEKAKKRGHKKKKGHGKARREVDHEV